MAKNDIRPFSHPMGGHGRVHWVRLNASETFVAGEPVSINADGELTESADDPVDADLFGIALASGDTVGATDGNGTFKFKIGAFAPGTGYPTTGDLVPVQVPDSNTYFITKNFSAAGSAFADASPALADIGDEVGLSLISGSWGVDQSATNNTCRIVDVLDANLNSIQLSGGTGTQVVFQIVAHQSASLGSADAPAA